MAKKSSKSNRRSQKGKTRPSKQAAASAEHSTSRRKTRSKGNVTMPFERRNYLLMGAGILCIVLGYVIMRMENEMDGFISLYVAPLIILFGYMEIIYAVVWRKKEEG